MNTAPGLRFDAFPRALAWSPDGSVLAAGFDTGRLVLVDGSSRVIRDWRGHEGGVLALGWNPRRGGLATAGEDGRIRLWRRDDPHPAAEMDGGAAWVEHAAWSPDGTLLATAGGRSVRFWSPEGVESGRKEPLPSTVAAIAWKGTGGALAAATYGEIQLIEPGQGGPPERLAWKSSFVSLAWSSDGRHLAAGTQENTITYWPLPSDGEPPLQMSGYPSKVQHLAWDRASRFLASGGGPVVTVWDVAGGGPAGTVPRQLEGHDDRVSALQWQAAGDVLASGARDGSVCLWRPKVSAKGLRAARLPGAVCALSWSPDGSRLAVVSADGALLIVAL